MIDNIIHNFSTGKKPTGPEFEEMILYLRNIVKPGDNIVIDESNDCRKIHSIHPSIELVRNDYLANYICEYKGVSVESVHTCCYKYGHLLIMQAGVRLKFDSDFSAKSLVMYSAVNDGYEPPLYNMTSGLNNVFLSPDKERVYLANIKLSLDSGRVGCYAIGMDGLGSYYADREISFTVCGYQLIK